MNALQWLMENGELYKSSGINIDHSWRESIENDNQEVVQELVGTSSSTDERETEPNNDGFCEVAADDNIQGNSDTLVDEADNDTNKAYAPGENQRPVSLYEDKDAEYFCFPTIFCGQRRVENNDRVVSVYYSDVAKCELRSVDRRAAKPVPNIFSS